MRNIQRAITANTRTRKVVMGAMWSRKSLKERPAREPIMMLGGSPIRVAAPPMLQAMTSAIR